MADLFDAAGMYDEDYLRFFATPGDGTEPGEAAADLTWRLLDLRPGVRVLDLACGHGEPACHLAARGCRGAAFVKRLFGYPSSATGCSPRDSPRCPATAKTDGRWPRPTGG
jgi:hypothetical protein